MECIFCQIAKKKIKADIIWEDKDVIAVYDIDPKAKVHALIFPKSHLGKSAHEKKVGLALKQIFSAIRIVAQRTGIDKTGFRVVTNHLKDAGQTVDHVHFHLLGGHSLGRMCD
ncbi:MAG: HIT domain-containing protein [Candidatus Berkelbacteria bacterium]|nr:HIT domain-containing protein [Candidatus Berkelbacteria bacterium]